MEKFIIEEFINSENKYPCVYAIYNLDTNKYYIGKTTNFLGRALNHRTTLVSNTHPNKYLQNAFNKGQHFSIFVLEFCNKTELNTREIIWIAFFKANLNKYGYNLTLGGEGTVGVIWDEDRRRARSEQNRLRGTEAMVKKNSKPIMVYDLSGNYINTFKSGAEAARSLGITECNVYTVLNNKQKTSKGYYFKRV